MALYAARVIVKGNVQGVSFRSFTKRNADILGLNGFVKNLDDNKVEVFAEGDKDSIEALVEALRTGPDQAVVKKVDIEWKPYTRIYPDFKVIY